VCDGVQLASQSADAARHFSGHFERKLIPEAGHFLSREAPLAVVQAIRGLGER